MILKVTQITARYNKLKTAIQQILTTSQARLDEHDAYIVALTSCQEALTSASDRLNQCKTTTGKKSVLQDQLALVEVRFVVFFLTYYEIT